MSGPDDTQHGLVTGARQVVRLLLAAFVASAAVMLVGALLAVEHHRTAGIVVFAVGAVGGFAVRARLMVRRQRGQKRRAR